MSKQNKSDKPIRELLAELDKVITWFDQDNFDLDEALQKFDEGVILADEVKERLTNLEHKITILKQRFDQGADQP